jgi:hypothetical protein
MAKDIRTFDLNFLAKIQYNIDYIVLETIFGEDKVEYMVKLWITKNRNILDFYCHFDSKNKLIFVNFLWNKYQEYLKE